MEITGFRTSGSVVELRFVGFGRNREAFGSLAIVISTGIIDNHHCNTSSKLNANDLILNSQSSKW